MTATIEPAAAGPVPTESTTTDSTTAEPGPSELAPPDYEVRRTTSGTRLRDRVAEVGAVAASFCVTALIYFWIAPFSGVLGFLVLWYGLFLLLYAALLWLDGNGPEVRDRLARAVIRGVAAVLILALLSVVLFTGFRGYHALIHLNFYTQDLRTAGPLEPLTRGGALHAVVGTLEQIGIALVITVPLSIVCALFLTETRGPFTRFVRTIVEAMTALPSIVAGLFIYATVLLILGFGKSGFAASLAISVMMLPIVVRAADVVLRLVPGSLKEASLALGASRWATVRHVVLPTARPGLATAVILGTARGIGETSPVLLTAGYSVALNANPFRDPQVSLPLATFSLVRAPEPNVIARGFGTATVLLVLVVVLFLVARAVGGRGPNELTTRQRRARNRASARDLARFARPRPPASVSPAPTPPAPVDPAPMPVDPAPTPVDPAPTPVDTAPTLVDSAPGPIDPALNPPARTEDEEP